MDKQPLSPERIQQTLDALARLEHVDIAEGIRLDVARSAAYSAYCDALIFGGESEANEAQLKAAGEFGEWLMPNIGQVLRSLKKLKEVAPSLLEELSRREPQWQSIETAPKDGTVIVAISADAEEPYPFPVKWDEKEPHHWPVVPAPGDDPEDAGWLPAATHWMPLPSSPKTVGGAHVGEEDAKDGEK